MPDLSFYDFHSTMGFTEYPFATFNTESELAKSKDLYFQPQNYSIILQLFSGNSSVVVHGERGSGKTALAADLSRNIRSEHDLYVVVDDLRDLKQGYDHTDLCKCLCQKIAESFFEWSVRRSGRIWTLKKEDRIILSYYLENYVRPVSRDNLKKKIFELQNPLWKILTIGLFNQSRGILNYGLNAASAFANDVVTKHFSGLPSNTTKYNEYLKEAKLGTDQTYEKFKQEFESLSRLAKIIRIIGIKRLIIKIDKLDEDPRFNNSAEDIAEFVTGIASDNLLLLHDDMQFVFFLWTTPFNYIKDSMRTQKLSVHKLEWPNADLIKALDKRLNVFSKGRVKSHSQIIDPNLTGFQKILELSNQNPRDLWHIMDKCLQAQFRINSSGKTISADAINEGIEKFVKGFNFYEYYPRKSNARANSLDIYSYIKHLSKLSGTSFTKDQLNREAGTGSSSSNYVTSMENMGLISKTEGKASGSVLYKIKDPKVIFAIENKIDIFRES